MEHSDQCTRKSKELYCKYQKYPLPPPGEFLRSRVFVLCVGVLIIKLWHHQRSSDSKANKANSHTGAPETTDEERPADGLNSIQLGYH